MTDKVYKFYRQVLLNKSQNNLERQVFPCEFNVCPKFDLKCTKVTLRGIIIA